jgi:hypothetical protein
MDLGLEDLGTTRGQRIAGDDLRPSPGRERTCGPETRIRRTRKAEDSVTGLRQMLWLLPARAARAAGSRNRRQGEMNICDTGQHYPASKKRYMSSAERFSAAMRDKVCPGLFLGASVRSRSKARRRGKRCLLRDLANTYLLRNGPDTTLDRAL